MKQHQLIHGHGGGRVAAQDLEGGGLMLAEQRSTILSVCATPRTRREIFEALGGRRGIGRQRFQGLLSRMLTAGELERAGSIANPLKGRGRNNVAEVLLYRATGGGAA